MDIHCGGVCGGYSFNGVCISCGYLEGFVLDKVCLSVTCSTTLSLQGQTCWLWVKMPYSWAFKVPTEHAVTAGGAKGLNTQDQEMGTFTRVQSKRHVCILASLQITSSILNDTLLECLVNLNGNGSRLGI